MMNPPEPCSGSPPIYRRSSDPCAPAHAFADAVALSLFRANGNGQQAYGDPQQSGNGRRFASRFGPAPPRMQPAMGMGMGMGMGQGSGSFSGMLGGPSMPPRAAAPPPPPPPPPQPVGPRVAEEFMVPLKVPCHKLFVVFGPCSAVVLGVIFAARLCCWSFGRDGTLVVRRFPKRKRETGSTCCIPLPDIFRNFCVLRTAGKRCWW